MFWPIRWTLKYCVQHPRKVLSEEEQPPLLPTWNEDMTAGAGAGAAVLNPNVKVAA